MAAASADSKTRKRGVTPEKWLPPGWKMEDRVRNSGATAGSVDRYYYDPSGRRFRSKNEVMHFLEHGTPSKKNKGMDNSGPSDKQGTKPREPSFNFDYLNAPEEISWIVTNALEESWTAFIGEEKVPESSTQDWATALRSQWDCTRTPTATDGDG